MSTQTFPNVKKSNIPAFKFYQISKLREYKDLRNLWNSGGDFCSVSGMWKIIKDDEGKIVNDLKDNTPSMVINDVKGENFFSCHSIVIFKFKDIHISEVELPTIHISPLSVYTSPLSSKKRSLKRRTEDITFDFNQLDNIYTSIDRHGFILIFFKNRKIMKGVDEIPDFHGEFCPYQIQAIGKRVLTLSKNKDGKCAKCHAC